MNNELQDGRFKFLNCKFRSEDVISKNIKRCACQGGSYTDQGYQCNKRNIFKINPDICTHCSEFENK
jgi:hypothetical protein